MLDTEWVTVITKTVTYNKLPNSLCILVMQKNAEHINQLM